MDKRKTTGLQGKASIATGLGALVIVLLVVVWVDRKADRDEQAPGAEARAGTIGAGPATAAKARPSAASHADHGHTEGAPLPAEASVVLLPAASTSVADAGLLRLSELSSQPEAHVGERFGCRNLVAPLPQRWQAERDGLTRLLARSGLRLAPHRLTLVCEGADLKVVLVHAFAHIDRADLLRAARRESLLEMRVLGSGPTGVLLAEVESVVEVGAPLDPTLPDLAEALLDSDTAAGRVIACRSEGAATILVPERMPEAARAWLQRVSDATRMASSAAPAPAAPQPGAAPAAGTPPTADAAAGGPVDFAVVEVRCMDRAGAAVPALLRAPQRRGQQWLQVRAGTVLSVQLDGAADDRLLGQLLGITSGAAPAVRDPLRLALIAGASDSEGVARRVAANEELARCTSLGLPLPEVLDDDGVGIVDPHAQRRAPLRTWLVCGGPGLPPTHVSLYFQERDAERLLEIGRGTTLSLRLFGSDGQRVFAELAQIVEGALDARSQATDLRRFVVERRRLQGNDFTCAVGRVEPLRSTPGVSRPGARLIAIKRASAGVDATPLRVECLDTLRPFDGQAFEVYFANAEERVRAPLRVGAKLQLRFVGVRQNQPIAIYRGVASSGPGDVRASK